MISNQSAKFDLNVIVIPRREQDPSSFTLNWEYSADLFEPPTIERMVGHYFRLLEEIIADPSQRISDLPILTEAEKHQLIVEWNKTERDYPKDKCVHQLFEEQVERTPETVAVVFEDRQLTYRELNSRANQLAHYLKNLGVGPEVLVGICVERSLEMIVGLLGILKAGGAYVPLDPQYPKERLTFMLEDAKVKVLLAQQGVVTELPEQQARVVDLDRDWGEIAQESEENPNSEITGENLAYVIYTSGSTGKPKGVLITHHNVVRLFQATNDWFSFNASDVWTLFHSYAFDFSVWEMWGALLNGGRLIVIPRAVSRSVEEFAALVKANGVTVLNQTPSAFRQLMPRLISTLAPEQSALRYVIFGGEALELQCLQPWFDCYGDGPAQLINMYGITETTVHVTYRPITQADIKSKAGSVVGRPIPDLRVYVLDERGQLLPVGIPGEIHVGGAGVAKGYLQRPELTAERFIADSFSSDPRARLYRTGDLARRLPDGELEYLGRIDDQVKIRGYRIEPGEIEAVLGQHPAIREAVVLAREDNPGDQRLVAYVVGEQGESFDAAEIRKYLKQKLPEYMIPSAFVLLDELPLTPNGKVDQEMPAPDHGRPELDDAFVAPRNPVEAILANIWAEVLKLEKVGVRDNFFNLGGHSLLAMQVISRMRNAFSVDVPLGRMFDAPTIAEMATIIMENQARILREIDSMSEEDAERSMKEIESTIAK